MKASAMCNAKRGEGGRYDRALDAAGTALALYSSSRSSSSCCRRRMANAVVSSSSALNCAVARAYQVRDKGWGQREVANRAAYQCGHVAEVRHDAFKGQCAQDSCTHAFTHTAQ